MSESNLKTDKVKLVIWDLDNTIWDGTLAECSDVKLFPNMKEIIIGLNKRGIVNSICSKNNYEEAKAKLTELGLWEWFVFPSIDFTAKGSRVASIIDDMHLRAENVLYVDDNPNMLLEVSFYNKAISTVLADQFKFLLKEPALQGKDDSKLSRLDQYRQLEKKSVASKKATSNLEFLKSIHIKVHLIDCVPSLVDRAYEMIERTNQLNFTKKRISKDELRELFKDPSITCQCVHVYDDFGDSGIVGFYAIQDNRLLHFMFSCRIINMGVEQYLYTKLGDPELQTVEPVASHVQKGLPLCDYITEVNFEASKSENREELNKYFTEENKLNLYAVGACDLWHMIGDLAMPNVDMVYECNTFHGNDRGVNVGTEYIRSNFDMTKEEKEFCTKHFYNYTEKFAFKSKLKEKNYDYCIFSFHDDFMYPIFENKENPKIRILRYREAIFNDSGEYMSYAEGEEWLKENFHEPHRITKERFYENLQWLRDSLPEKTTMILVNGPEINVSIDEASHNQIVLLNKVIKQFVEEHPDNTELVDVNQFIVSRDKYTDYIFHWTMEVNYQVTLETLKKMALHGNDHEFKVKKELPIGNRKVVLYGNNKFTKLSYYSLISHGCHISDICYDTVDEQEGIKAVQEFLDKKEEYYFIITQDDTAEECMNTLKKNGLVEKQDFICYVPEVFYHEFSDRI